jgi:demethylmenaquinone methyltransferase/2-methoxy-6-polyprenyl-1,4-benzoquinol methylase
MNDLMSLGIHRLWKRFTIELSGVRKGQTVLDIAGGTGDLASLFAKRVGTEGQVYLADINSSMLAIGQDRLIDKGLIGNIHFVQADVEHLPFPENHFDCISIAFGLRNVTRQDIALCEMYRTLKPGGRLLILEFSKPTLPGLQPLYDTYSFSVLPFLGQCITGSEESYRYLAESIRKHPDQETLKSMMQSAGLSGCEYYNLSGGIVALHRGYKS